MAATLDDIYTEVRAMLLGLFSCEVVRGYSNNVPLPKPPFVVMNILNEAAASTNEHAYDAADETAAVSRQSEIQMQLDFYGEEAGRMAQETVLLWRDSYACERLESCRPLYADPARFMPLTNEEGGYEERWTAAVYLSYAPQAEYPQQFVNAFDLTLIQP
ncbi:LIC_12616 family protein [Neisseria sp. LACPHL-SPEC-2024-00856]|uniref:phage neck terminator protein n=1 Tax=Neisseria sp. LACPHL-SPEC-2024-00856 TaxID=3391057 RepID=UPI003A4DCE6B